MPITAVVGSVPRAPGRLPLVGHAVVMARRPLSFLQSLRSVGRIVRVDIGPRSLYFLNSPELARECMVDKGDRFDRGSLGERLRPLVGRGAGGVRRAIAPAATAADAAGVPL